jgi:hypothetical protein
MKPCHCDRCPKRKACSLEYDNKINEWIVICPLMKAELKRVECGRKKNAIHITYQSNMGRLEAIQFDNTIYGAFQGE